MKGTQSSQSFCGCKNNKHSDSWVVFVTISGNPSVFLRNKKGTFYFFFTYKDLLLYVRKAKYRIKSARRISSRKIRVYVRQRTESMLSSVSECGLCEYNSDQSSSWYQSVRLVRRVRPIGRNGYSPRDGNELWTLFAKLRNIYMWRSDTWKAVWIDESDIRYRMTVSLRRRISIRFLSRDRVCQTRTRYLVDPASSHMLVSKIKPCMSKYKP